MPRRITSADHPQILELHARGLDWGEIAAELGVSVAVVKRHAQTIGIFAPRSCVRDSRARGREIVALRAQGLTYGQIAEALGISETRAAQIGKQAGAVARLPRTPKHGSPTEWMRGCRCDVCEPARQAYKRDEYAKARERGPITHGAAGYVRGCDCAKCRAAGLMVLRERQASTVEGAKKHGEVWTDADTVVALDASLLIAERARILGRTYAAVDNRVREVTRSRARREGDA